MERKFEIDPKEAARYLGYGKKEPDKTTQKMIADCIELLWECADFRVTCQTFPLQVREDSLIFAGITVTSRSLFRNLKGCEQVILFAATLGIGVDRQIERLAKIDLSRCIVMQACAAAAIESYCDYLGSLWEKEQLEQGLYLRPRFSPGYGDFPLEYQRDFLRILDAPKKIGLSLTDSLMLVPVKSVTALIGCSSTPTACHKAGCESCSNLTCMYRR